MTYEEKQVPIKVEGKWYQRIYTYDNESMKGHPVSESNKEVTQQYVDDNYADILNPKPTHKSFPVGDVFRCFDGESITMKMAFFANPLVAATVYGLQDITLSVKAIDNIANDVEALKQANVISGVPYTRLVALISKWKGELSDA